MVEAVTRDMASSDWLRLAALCLFRSQSVSKNKSICDCPGARLQSDRSALLSNRPFHGFWRHLGWVANTGKFTVNVCDFGRL